MDCITNIARMLIKCLYPVLYTIEYLGIPIATDLPPENSVKNKAKIQPASGIISGMSVNWVISTVKCTRTQNKPQNLPITRK